jgi:formylglycine-generating enzyme required for sulfatase activity
MKKRINHVILILILFFHSANGIAQYSKKQVKQFLNDFQLLEYSGVGLYACENLYYTGLDSNFLHSQIQGDFSNANTYSYLIKKNEISVREYKAFISWVRDSMYRETLYLKGFKKFGNPIEGTDAFGRNYQINWKSKIDFNEEEVIKALDKFYFPEESRFYKRREKDNSILSYTYISSINQKGTTVSVGIYPDTLCWNRKSLPYESNNLNVDLSGYYFWHPAYDNYPIIGVNWHQTQAFCHFLTKQMKDLLGSFIGEDFIGFRLPTELEWINSTDVDTLNPCSTNFFFNSDATEINVNMGMLQDQSGLILQNPEWRWKNILYLSKEKEPNSKGIYNLHGNVAEWLQDSLVLPNLNNKAHIFEVPYLDESNQIVWLAFDVNKQVQKIPQELGYQILPDLPNYENEEYIVSGPGAETLYLMKQEVEKTINAIQHDEKLLEMLPNARLIKGGSWNDPLIYLLPQTRSIQQEQTATATTGFRIVLTLTEKQQQQLKIYYSK